MTSRRPKYCKEEFVRRGDAIYDRDVALKVKSGQKGQFVAIAIDSGEFEIDPNEMTAFDRLLAR